MIGKIKNLEKICCDDISLIENYNEAINDPNTVWHCHHRLEIQDGKTISARELIKQNLYYHRPASELIFLRPQDHGHLHTPPKDSKDRAQYINPAAFSKKKCLWITPDGKVKKMNKYQANKWHPDWRLLSEHPDKFTPYDIFLIENS